MMSDEAAFLRAICAEPDDDTPRLVFADWLDEQGGAVNAGWAELIRVQVALARDPGWVQKEHLRERERELLGMEAAWARRIGLPCAGSWQNWSRGFPLTFQEYSGPDLARLASAPPVPLHQVELTDATDDEFENLARWPGLRHVRRLALWEVRRPFTRGVLALAGCEHLANLEWLRIARVDLTDEAAVALLDSPYLARLADVRLAVVPRADLSLDVQSRLALRFGDQWDRL